MTRGVWGVTSWVRSSDPSQKSFWGRVKAVGFGMHCQRICWHPAIPTQHGAASHQQTHSPSGVSTGQGSRVLERDFNSCYIPREWQQQVQEPAEQGCGWLMGNFGIAGGKAAWLSALLPQTQPALGPHSPGTDKSYRKRGDLSLRLAWLLSAQRGERSTTQQAGASAAPGAEGHLIGCMSQPGCSGIAEWCQGRHQLTRHL